MPKKIVTIVLCSLFISIYLFAQSKFAPGSEPTEFKGMRWGASLSAFSGMNLKKADPGEIALNKIYPERKSSGSLERGMEISYRSQDGFSQIEGVSVDEINYIFRDNKFCGVLIVGRGVETFEQLKKIYFAKYGEAGLESPAGSPVGGYLWYGEKVDAALVMIIGDVVAFSISCK